MNAYSGSGDNMTRAAQIASEMYKAKPNSAYSYAAIAEIYFGSNNQRGDPPGEVVMTAAEKAISLSPKLAEPLLIKARLFLAEGMVEEAKKSGDAALKLSPEKPEVMFVQARVAELSRNYADAEAWYLKDINALTDPDRKSNVYGWMGNMLASKQPPEVARGVEAMRKSVELSPTSPWKLSNHASFLVRYTTNFDEAIDHAERALKIMNFGAARRNLGFALYGKWAVLTMGGNPQPGLDPKSIEARTGISPEQVLACTAKSCIHGMVGASLRTYLSGKSLGSPGAK